MRFEQRITYIYQCSVCEAEYESEEKMKAKRKAKRCEKLPVEEKKFKEGDKVGVIEEHYEVDLTGVISAIKLCSPVDNDYLVGQIKVSKKSHFYLYDIEVTTGALVTFPARDLKKI